MVRPYAWIPLMSLHVHSFLFSPTARLIIVLQDLGVLVLVAVHVGMLCGRGIRFKLMGLAILCGLRYVRAVMLFLAPFTTP